MEHVDIIYIKPIKKLKYICTFRHKYSIYLM